MSSDELVPLQTCQRLVHYRGRRRRLCGGRGEGGRGRARTAARRRARAARRRREPGARSSGRARNFCAPLSQPWRALRCARRATHRHQRRLLLPLRHRRRPDAVRQVRPVVPHALPRPSDGDAARGRLVLPGAHGKAQPRQGPRHAGRRRRAGAAQRRRRDAAQAAASTRRATRWRWRSSPAPRAPPSARAPRRRGRACGARRASTTTICSSCSASRAASRTTASAATPSSTSS